MKSTRRDFLQRAGALALGAPGIYGIAEALATRPAYGAPGARRRPAEQHVAGRLRLVRDNGIEVVVPPLHHQVVTARLRIEPTRAALRSARTELESALLQLERQYGPVPAGVDVLVAWGLSYFRTYLSSLANATAFPRYLPID